jgi:hypothetical protein
MKLSLIPAILNQVNLYHLDMGDNKNKCLFNQQCPFENIDDEVMTGNYIAPFMISNMKKKRKKLLYYNQIY